MKARPSRIGDRVRCGSVEVLATVTDIRSNGMVLTVVYDDAPSEEHGVHLYDCELVVDDA